MPWKRAWQAIPVFLPGKSLGQRSQARKELDTTDGQYTHSHVCARAHTHTHTHTHTHGWDKEVRIRHEKTCAIYYMS